MPDIKVKPQNIEQYVNSVPDEAQDKLKEILDCLRNAAPQAQESLKWGESGIHTKSGVVYFSCI